MLSVRMKMGTHHWYRFSVLLNVLISNKGVQKEVVKLIYKSEFQIPEHCNVCNVCLVLEQYFRLSLTVLT
jgi:hypothetical protein